MTAANTVEFPHIDALGRPCFAYQEQAPCGACFNVREYPDGSTYYGGYRSMSGTWYDGYWSE